MWVASRRMRLYRLSMAKNRNCKSGKINQCKLAHGSSVILARSIVNVPRIPLETLALEHLRLSARTPSTITKNRAQSKVHHLQLVDFGRYCTRAYSMQNQHSRSATRCQAPDFITLCPCRKSFWPPESATRADLSATTQKQLEATDFQRGTPIYCLEILLERTFRYLFLSLFKNSKSNLKTNQAYNTIFHHHPHTRVDEHLVL